MDCRFLEYLHRSGCKINVYIMQEERIKNLVRSWRHKSHQDGDVFGSFIFIWISFNAWLEHLSMKTSDREMIEELRERAACMNELVSAYDYVLKNDELFIRSLRALIGKSREEPIRDVREIFPDVVIENEYDYENVIRALYRIRCNLFHGGKDINEPRDQSLVSNAGALLRQWVGRLEGGWG